MHTECFRAQHERYIMEQERRRQEHIRAQEAALAGSGKPSPVGSDGSRDSRPSSTHPRDDSRERPPSHGRHSTGPQPVSIYRDYILPLV